MYAPLAGETGGAQSNALPLPLPGLFELGQAAAEDRAVARGGGGGDEVGVFGRSEPEIR